MATQLSPIPYQGVGIASCRCSYEFSLEGAVENGG
jgi:hypothetical protein